MLNMLKNKLTLVLGFAVLFFACSEELDIVNQNEPDSERALGSPSDLIALQQGATNTAFSQVVGFSAVYLDEFADQITSTNNFASFWAMNDQPRREFSNLPTNSDLGRFHGNYTSFNVAIANANAVIAFIEGEGVVVENGVDRTQEMLASGYFIKGLSLGYLGLIYDQAFIASPGASADEAIADNLKPYTEVMAAAIENLESALAIYQTDAPSFNSLSGNSFPAALMSQVINSYIARFLINTPRTATEAAALDYGAILGYANNGITSDFEPVSVQDDFFANYQDWRLFILSSGAGYLPVDNKIPYLANNDGTHPADYPSSTTVLLPPVSTDDARIEDYYDYTEDFGFLNPARNRLLFTNYKHLRYWDNNDENVSGLPVQVFMKVENDMIRAECMNRMGNPGGAKTILDASPRVTVGGLAPVAATEQAVDDAIFYEYCVELDAACGVGIHWGYMRRHDLLQAGTPTQMPIPGDQLEVLQLGYYTFGGPANAGSEGTASGSNDWRN